MRNNIGTMTKKITIIVPESTEIIDLCYYWKSATGAALKTVTTIMDESCTGGTEVNLCKFPEEEM